MVPVMSLWMPILLSAVIVFVASSLIHMVLGYHKNDFRRLPDEDGVLEALGKFEIPPGDYNVPCAGSMAAMKDPAFVAKLKKGPVLIATFLKPGGFDMGSNLLQWFVYCVVVSLFAAYVTGIAMGPGDHYRPVFRMVSTVAFAGYVLAQWQSTIWYKKSVGTTLRNTLDGLVYALLTGGAFGWLWPR
jgi:hypothetical protein